MNNSENKKDILLISKIVLVAITVGIVLVTAHQVFNKNGFLLPIIWAFGFLMVGGLFGFLYGMPRVLFADEANNSPTKETSTVNKGKTQKRSYQVSSHLERILEWLTTLIVGLTLVQWEKVVSGFNSIARFISEGINAEFPTLNQSFAASIMVYFPLVGFLGAYLITRVYLSRVFEENDVGNGLGIDEAEKHEINKIDLSNPQSINLNSNFSNAFNKSLAVSANNPILRKNTAEKILSIPLEQISSLEDIISWSKTQLAAGSYIKAAEGYKKAIEITPLDIQLKLEFVNSLYHSGINTTEPLQIQKIRAESEANLLMAYSLLNNTTEPDLRMKVFRAITFFYLYLDPPKGFENTIKYGEEFINDPDPKKIQSGGVLVNLACAYGQKYKWLQELKADQSLLDDAQANALRFTAKALKIDKNDLWLNRLRILIQTNIAKDPSDNDLEIFENNEEFRQMLKLPPVITLPKVTTDAGNS